MTIQSLLETYHTTLQPGKAPNMHLPRPPRLAETKDADTAPFSCAYHFLKALRMRELVHFNRFIEGNFRRSHAPKTAQARKFAAKTAVHRDSDILG